MSGRTRHQVTIPEELMFEPPGPPDPIVTSFLRLLEHPNQWAVVATFDSATGGSNRVKTYKKKAEEAQKSKAWGDGTWDFAASSEGGSSRLHAIFIPTGTKGEPTRQPGGTATVVRTPPPEPASNAFDASAARERAGNAAD